MFYQLAGKSRDESPAVSLFLSWLQAPSLLSAMAQLKYGPSQETDLRARYRDEGGGRCGKYKIGVCVCVCVENTGGVFNLSHVPSPAVWCTGQHTPGSSSLLLAPASGCTRGTQIGGRRPKNDCLSPLNVGWKMSTSPLPVLALCVLGTCVKVSR